MLTQNKKIITYIVITITVILIMAALSVVIINYLAREINQALTDKGVKATIKGFDFKALETLGIEEINKILESGVPNAVIDTSSIIEGPELLSNSRFDESGVPWFTWVQMWEMGEISISDGKVKVALKETSSWSAGIGQGIGVLDSGNRYRFTFEAANSGGPSFVHFQIAKKGENVPVEVIINGKSNQDEKIFIGEKTKRYVVDFAIPPSLNFLELELVLVLGDLRNAYIDNASLRKIISASSIATSTTPNSSIKSPTLSTSTTSTVSH